VLAQDDLALRTGVDRDLARRYAEGNTSKAATKPENAAGKRIKSVVN
jgi:hypothetical protein